VRQVEADDDEKQFDEKLRRAPNFGHHLSAGITTSEWPDA
jgi:hypothetical protein